MSYNQLPRAKMKSMVDVRFADVKRRKDTTFQPKPPGACKDCGKKMGRSAWLNKNMCFNRNCPGKKTIGQIEAEKKAKHADEPTGGAVFAYARPSVKKAYQKKTTPRKPGCRYCGHDVRVIAGSKSDYHKCTNGRCGADYPVQKD